LDEDEIAASVAQVFGLAATPTLETRECLAHLKRENLVRIG
jgi:hypothetical protein